MSPNELPNPEARLTAMVETRMDVLIGAFGEALEPSAGWVLASPTWRLKLAKSARRLRAVHDVG